MTNEQLVKFWVETSDSDYEAMNVLFENKQYSWSLFIGHLVLEKLFKALYAKQNPQHPHAPKIHDLLALAHKCSLEIEQDTEEKLDTVTNFNISARYDDFKKNFYKICTRDYTETQINTIKGLRQWLKKLI